MAASDYAVDAAELETRVVDLKHNQGKSFAEIADLLGLSKSYIHRVFWRAVRRAPTEKVEECRAAMLARIETRRAVAEEVMTADHPLVQQGRVIYPVTGRDEETGKPTYADEPLMDDGPRLAALARLDALDDQEAKLLGLYAAAKVEHDSTVRYEVVGVSPEDVV